MWDRIVEKLNLRASHMYVLYAALYPKRAQLSLSCPAEQRQIRKELSTHRPDPTSSWKEDAVPTTCSDGVVQRRESMGRNRQRKQYAQRRESAP